MNDQSSEIVATNFLFLMHNEIEQCLQSYDRNIYVRFKHIADKLSFDIPLSQIDAHNSWLFRMIMPTLPLREIMRIQLFLLPSPNLSVSDLFSSLTMLTPYVRPDNFFYKMARRLHFILTRDLNLFEQFSKKFTPQNVRWVHFCVIDKSLSILPPNNLASVMRCFQTASINFNPQQLTGVSKFIRGITPQIFDAFLKPFLDQQTLRNIDSFINIIKYYLKPLCFCRNKVTPHHGTDFIEAISQACESSNPKLQSKANDIVEFLATKISPYAFPFNQKSIAPFFQSVTICKSSVNAAFLQLKKPLPQPTKAALLSFLTKAAHLLPQLFDVNQFVMEYLLKPPQFLLLLLVLDVPNLDTNPIRDAVIGQNTPLCLVIRSMLCLCKLKESDLFHLYIPQNFKKYSSDEVTAFSQILYQVRNEMPEFASKNFVFSAISTNFQSNVISVLELSMTQCSNAFISGLFSMLRSRNPNELKIFVPVLKKFTSTYNDDQRVICLALGIEISEGSDEVIVNGLFKLLLTNADWKKKAESQLIRSCSHPQRHIVIAKLIAPYVQNPDFTNILSALFLSFSVSSDRDIFETIFQKESSPESIIKTCLSAHPYYFQNPTILCKMLKKPELAATTFSREFVFSFLPKKNMREFDFLIFLPFYKTLLEVPTYDYICERIGEILCQFDYITFERSGIMDELEDFPEADQVLAHLYGSDQLAEITDGQVARRIVNRKDFASYFKEEMTKYGRTFYTEVIITALTTHNIFVEPLPSVFKKYLTYMVSFDLDNNSVMEIVSNTVFKHYRGQADAVVDTVLEVGIKRPELCLAILSKLTSIGSRSQHVFNFLMTMKKKQINATHFNEVVQQFLLPEYSDRIIEKFFSVPGFVFLPDETLPSLYYSIKTSSKSVPVLFEMIKSQCSPKDTDRTIEILVSCLRVLRQTDNAQLVEISNNMIANSATTKGEHLGLVFHFSTNPNKMELLGQWITSNNMKAKALMILRYLFTIQSEASHLHTLLNNLISLTTSPDMKIVESATNALRAAANSLNPSMVDEITPFIISTIKPELSRFALEAALQFLIQVEKNSSLILLPYLPALFLALQSLKNSAGTLGSIDELFRTFEEHLTKVKNEKPGLYFDIATMIRTNKKPIDIYMKIDEKIEDTRKDETLTNIAYTMIEKDLSNIDLQVKMISFKILAELNLSEVLFEKAELTFYSLSCDPHRKEILPHFKVFLNLCSVERKERIFNFFLSQVNSDMKNFQSDGFSLLFGTILAFLNDEKYIANIIQTIKTTSNTMLRESLMSSLTEMFESNKDLICHQVLPITECFLSTQNSGLAIKLMKKLIPFLTPEITYSFMELVISFMSSPDSETREICVSLFLALLRSLHPFENVMNSRDNAEKEVFFKLFAAVICLLYDYVFNVNDKAYHLFSLLNQIVKIDLRQYTHLVLPYLKQFLTSQEIKVNLLGIYGLVHIARHVQKSLALMEELVSQWYQISVQKFPSQIIQCFVEVAPIELRAEIAKAILLQNGNILVTPESSSMIIFAFIDAKKYLKLITVASKKWPTQTSSFINIVLGDLFSMAHGIISPTPRIQFSKKPDNLPSQFKFQEKSKVDFSTNDDDDISIVKKESLEPFISLAILLANEAVVEFISKFELTPPDTIIIQLVGRMAHAKPDFFAQNARVFADSVFPIFFHDVPTDDIRIIEESIIVIVNSLKPMEVASFFRQTGPSFLNHRTLSIYSRSVLSDQFVSSLIDSVIKMPESSEMLPDFAYFLRAIFKYTSDKIRILNADFIIRKFIAALVQSDALSSGSADLIGAMRLFSTFIVNNTEILVIAEISACLSISRITPEIQCELISLIECALSMSVSHLQILKLFQEKAAAAPIAPVFECIAYLVQFSPPFNEIILTDLWKVVSRAAKSEVLHVRIAVAKVAALIAEQLVGDSRDSILDEVLTTNPDDSAVFCSFLLALNSLGILRQDHIENIQRLLGISDPNSCNFLSLIPMLARSGKKCLLLESLNFLVRGLRSRRYIIPFICLDTLRALQVDLREMDVKDSAVIITGCYFAFCRFQGELKAKALDTIVEILGKKSSFRETYFKAIDSSLAQAFQRDVFSVTTT